MKEWKRAIGRGMGIEEIAEDRTVERETKVGDGGGE